MESNDIKSKLSGRIATFSTQTVKGGVKKYCGKFVRETSKYIHFNDLNSGRVLKKAKGSVREISAGNLTLR